MEKKKIGFIVLWIVVGLVVGFLLGYYFVGKNVSVKQTGNTTALLNMAFPKPPDDLRTVAGTIEKIDGTKIQFTTADPEDYLPHTDGSAQKTMTRVANVTAQTEMFLIRPTQIDKNGNISRTTLKITDLKVGDAVTFTANANIRTTQTFDALLVEQVQY